MNFRIPVRITVYAGLPAVVVALCLTVGARGDDLMPLFSPETVNSDKESASDLPHSSPDAPAEQMPKSNAEEDVEEDVVASPSSAAAQTMPSEESTSPALMTKDALQRQKDLRFQELKRQIEILDRILPAASHTRQEHSQQDDGSQQESEPDAPGAESNEETDDLDQPPTNLQPSDSPELVSPDHESTTDDGPLPVRVVNGTIDRFALATSLFGTGEVESCLDVLDHTDLSTLPREDQIWGEYLRGCCHRKAGRLDLARQSYRRVLAEKDAGWLGDLSRWWLDNLDEKVRLQADIQRLSETLAAWEKEIESLARRQEQLDRSEQLDRATADR